MQEWRRLTPEERQTARANYKSASQLPADKRQELKQKWEEYSSLPEEEKEKLKKQASTRPTKPVMPAIPDAPARSLPPAAALLPAWEPGGQSPLPVLPPPAKP